ncbi:1-deoxy-D-xylulose 5-phosphate reductoisomerase [Oleiphilus messinensis]|uniref:1-deoxy-D-xylulose 5-phosphate reductoisomerase n=1 Tax=Oleiphilus messinensis TaxID=141451 RepID=A0A1Y0I747_9GAMM|nr:1-deoxy-D-xylulose-5-phosphate reductoisomerase [Oleiphilus messinensis]ARU56050.1 1-deoxy-D-xylulose 5-phosphate reductoisomerase [Oleiphilus messinensis]
MKKVSILGSTGSIGESTLAVIRENLEQYQVHSLVANSNLDAMYRQCLEFVPEYVLMRDTAAAQTLKALLLEARVETQVLCGDADLEALMGSSEIDYVMSAIVGAAGLKPTMAAVESGKRILLANKESLVIAGELFMSAVQQYGCELLPIDSEHNAIYQCLPISAGNPVEPIRRILLTASGGPFRRFTADELEAVTPAQALKHPNWDMGPKITIDSASLMNKGLELIEACWLFNVSPDVVDVHIHPQSIIHSMVEYVDGSILAQMGSPDMRTPIAYGLGWPDRIESGVPSLDLFAMADLTFEKPDMERFPCLALAAQVFKRGGTAPTLLNAANEVAVGLFLENRIRFTEIPSVIDYVLDRIMVEPVESIEHIMEQDRNARIVASQYSTRRAV